MNLTQINWFGIFQKHTTMKKNLILLILSVLIFQSCNKTYNYVEIVNEESIFGGSDTKEKDPKIIKAKNDSAAYLAAYQTFCISQEVNKDMQEAMGKVYSVPLRFKLINDKGEEISNTVIFANKEKLEKEIEDNIFSMRNSLKESFDKSKEEKIENFKRLS